MKKFLDILTLPTEFNPDDLNTITVFSLRRIKKYSGSKKDIESTKIKKLKE